MPEVFKIDKKGKLGPDNVKPHTVVDKMCLPGLTAPQSVKTFLTFFLLVNAVLAFACPNPPEFWAKRPPFAKFCPPN